MDARCSQIQSQLLTTISKFDKSVRFINHQIKNINNTHYYTVYVTLSKHNIANIILLTHNNKLCYLRSMLSGDEMSNLVMTLFRNVKVIMLLLMATNCMAVGGL